MIFLNDFLKSKIITYDVKNGVASYETSLDDTETPDLPDDVIDYEITASHTGGHPKNDGYGGTVAPTIRAVIPIPGRSQGPIVQEMKTRPEITRTVSGTLFLQKKNGNTDWNYGQDIADVRDKFFTLCLAKGFFSFLDTSVSGSEQYSASKIIDVQDDFNPRKGLYSCSVVWQATFGPDTY